MQHAVGAVPFLLVEVINTELCATESIYVVSMSSAKKSTCVLTIYAWDDLTMMLNSTM